MKRNLFQHDPLKRKRTQYSKVKKVTQDSTVQNEMMVTLQQSAILEKSDKTNTRQIIDFTFDLIYSSQISQKIITFRNLDKKWMYKFSEQKQTLKWKEALKKKVNQEGFDRQFRVEGKLHKFFRIIRKSNGQQLIAKKIYKTKLSQQNNGKQSLEKQVQILRKLDHPNILPLSEVFVSKQFVYLIFPFIEGQSLSELLASIYPNRLQSHKIKRYLFTILKAVRQIHHRKIFHRDLNPSNILISDENDQCLIMNFQLAEFSTLKTYLYHKCGTPGYIAPEILNQGNLQVKYTLACDMFSIGAIFYEIIFQKQLLIGKTCQQIIILNHQCSINFKSKQFNELTEEALDLLKRMLCPCPLKRIKVRQSIKHRYLYKIITKPIHLQPLIFIKPLEIKDKNRKKPFVQKMKTIQSPKKERDSLLNRKSMITSNQPMKPITRKKNNSLFYKAIPEKHEFLVRYQEKVNDMKY